MIGSQIVLAEMQLDHPESGLYEVFHYEKSSHFQVRRLAMILTTLS